jgi:protein-disulfide isomerase
MRRTSYPLVALALLTVIIPAFAQTATLAQNPPADEVQLLKNSEAFVRKLFAWGPEFQVKLGPASQSPAPGYYLVPVQITFGGQSDTGVLYISEDGKTLLRGELFDTSADPFAGNRAKLHPDGNPSKGPADARVTLVEFSDFQCPHCRQLYEAMKTLAPRYPQIRTVFKDLPIAASHPWAETAALGARCAYLQSPDAFWRIHDALFENQDFISAANIWERLIELAGQAGLDKDALKACLTSPEAAKAIEANIEDAKVLSVNSTPTVFVNGRPVVGGDPTTLLHYIDYELGGKQAAQLPAKPAPSTKPVQSPAQKPAQKPGAKP